MALSKSNRSNAAGGFRRTLPCKSSGKKDGKTEAKPRFCTPITDSVKVESGTEAQKAPKSNVSNVLEGLKGWVAQ